MRRILLHALLLTAALCGAALHPAVAAGATPAGKAQKQTDWDDLIPKDWDPLKRFKGMNMGALSDSDPKSAELLRQMRDTWDNAPTNSAMDGASVRLPGYVVPLDEVKGELKEFLLVPYFGACIHTPPPPANQIVHILADKPMKGLRMMDAVWVTGTLKTQRNDSVMGTSGYQLQALTIERYVEPAR